MLYLQFPYNRGRNRNLVVPIPNAILRERERFHLQSIPIQRDLGFSIRIRCNLSLFLYCSLLLYRFMVRIWSSFKLPIGIFVGGVCFTVAIMMVAYLILCRILLNLLLNRSSFVTCN